jgi:hypothetical protein
MIARRDDLDQALGEVEAKALSGVTTIVVSERWWNALSVNERESYRNRAERAAIELRADGRISSHFVELRGGEEGPPLSTERPM